MDLLWASASIDFKAHFVCVDKFTVQVQVQVLQLFLFKSFGFFLTNLFLVVICLNNSPVACFSPSKLNTLLVLRTRLILKTFYTAKAFLLSQTVT